MASDRDQFGRARGDACSPGAGGVAMTGNGKRNPAARLHEAKSQLATAEARQAELEGLRAAKLADGNVVELARLKSEIATQGDLILVINDVIAACAAELRAERQTQKERDKAAVIADTLAEPLKARVSGAAKIERGLCMVAEGYRELEAAGRKAIEIVASAPMLFRVPGPHDLRPSFARDRITRSMGSRLSDPARLDQSAGGIKDNAVAQNAAWTAGLKAMRFRPSRLRTTRRP